MTIEFSYCFCSSLGNRFGNGGVLFEELTLAVVQVPDFLFLLFRQIKHFQEEPYLHISKEHHIPVDTWWLAFHNARYGIDAIPVEMLQQLQKSFLFL